MHGAAETPNAREPRSAQTEALNFWWAILGSNQ